MSTESTAAQKNGTGDDEHSDHSKDDSAQEEGQDNAAKTIQRNYRGYKTRREAKGCGMSAAGRWREVLNDVQFLNMTTAQAKSEGSKGEGGSGKWQKLTGIAARAGNDQDDDSDAEDEADPPNESSGNKSFDYWLQQLRARQGQGEYSKTMGLEYWLEMVDRKHRYGSNLLKYHTVWNDADTKENFFYWLDEGDGKNEDLEGCPREKLEDERLHYLSREERAKYLIEVGDDGLLRWAESGEKVTTHASGEGGEGGIGGESETQNHATDDLHNARGILQGAGHAVPAPLAKLIEMNQDKASWIFVIDTQFRIYAGIKQSGVFQHSSFLHGSRVLSAGLIAAEDGYLLSLSPHSGHYRPTSENFWITAKCLEAEGVDMSRARIKGSYWLLRGTEGYRDGLSYVKEIGSAVYEKVASVVGGQDG